MYCKHLLLSTMVPSAAQRLVGVATASSAVLVSPYQRLSCVPYKEKSLPYCSKVFTNQQKLEPGHVYQGLADWSCRGSLSESSRCQLAGNEYGHCLTHKVQRSMGNSTHYVSSLNFHLWTHTKKHLDARSGHCPMLRVPYMFSNRRFSISPKAILEASPPSFQPYLRLIRFDKPIGTMLLLWPCTWSIALAANPGQLPDLWMLTLFSAGAFFMRGAGCIINDMWDKDYDKKVERTKQRPLASGELTHFQALVFLASQLSISLGILLQLNTYSILLGASSMILVVLYPLAKRYTYWPQIMLGVTLNWGVLLAWSGLKGGLDLSVASLYLACVLYTMFYDTVYSHQDKYDDMLIGVKSTALKLGDKTKLWLSGFSTLMISCLATTGYMCDQTWPYFAGVGVVAAHLAHQLYTVDLDNADDCASKFRSNSRLGFFLFLSIVAGTMLRQEDMEENQTSDKSNTVPV